VFATLRNNAANLEGLQMATDCLLKLSQTELAYMAGLIDGDGCIRIGHVGPLKRTYYATVEIGMTDLPTIEWVQKCWQSGTIKLNNHTAMRSRSPGWKSQWIVRIHGKRAQLLCRLLLPYLRTKKANAKLVIAFPCDARSTGITRAIKAKRLRLFLRMRSLNKRGPNGSDQHRMDGHERKRHSSV
jgi:hypothetical protein